MGSDFLIDVQWMWHFTCFEQFKWSQPVCHLKDFNSTEHTRQLHNCTKHRKCPIVNFSRHSRWPGQSRPQWSRRARAWAPSPRRPPASVCTGPSHTPRSRDSQNYSGIPFLNSSLARCLKHRCAPSQGLGHIYRHRQSPMKTFLTHLNKMDWQ